MISVGTTESKNFDGQNLRIFLRDNMSSSASSSPASLMMTSPPLLVMSKPTTMAVKHEGVETFQGPIPWKRLFKLLMLLYVPT